MKYLKHLKYKNINSNQKIWRFVPKLQFLKHLRGVSVSKNVAKCFPAKKNVMLQSKRGYCTKQYKKVTHCLFDLDGTVLNSEIIYHKILQTVCREYGKEYTKELQNKLYGGTDRDICLACVRELKLPVSVNEFEAKLTDLSRKQLPSAPLQKGAERLLTHFSDYKVPMALATNSTEQAVRWHATARPKLFGMFHHMVSATDPEVDKGKPRPDIYLIAASRFKEKPKPSQCLVFEDSYIGVQAANAAGMQVVMIPEDHKLDRKYVRHATLVLRSLLEFQPELFGLPPFGQDPQKKKKDLLGLYPDA